MGQKENMFSSWIYYICFNRLTLSTISFELLFRLPTLCFTKRDVCVLHVHETHIHMCDRTYSFIPVAAFAQDGEFEVLAAVQSEDSPGGTTEAALEILAGEAGLGDLMRRATSAAFQRARDLAGPEDDKN